jgi:hypothetical protein
MNITEKELRDMAAYIADYLAEENVAEVDSWLICRAMDAYIGGAADQN